jgi:hypothetical protein
MNDDTSALTSTVCFWAWRPLVRVQDAALPAGPIRWGWQRSPPRGQPDLQFLFLRRPSAGWFHESGNGIDHQVDIPLPAAAFEADQWHHLAATRTNGNRTVRMYFDGVEVGSGTFAAAAEGGEAGRLRIGSDIDQFGDCALSFGGALDLVYVYTRALSSGEVRALYDRDAP